MSVSIANLNREQADDLRMFLQGHKDFANFGVRSEGRPIRIWLMSEQVERSFTERLADTARCSFKLSYFAMQATGGETG